MRLQALSPKLVLLLLALCTITAIAVGFALATHIGQVHPFLISQQHTLKIIQMVVTHGEEDEEHDFPYQAATWLCIVSQSQLQDNQREFWISGSFSDELEEEPDKELLSSIGGIWK